MREGREGMGLWLSIGRAGDEWGGGGHDSILKRNADSDSDASRGGTKIVEGMRRDFMRRRMAYGVGVYESCYMGRVVCGFYVCSTWVCREMRLCCYVSLGSRFINIIKGDLEEAIKNHWWSIFVQVHRAEFCFVDLFPHLTTVRENEKRHEFRIRRKENECRS